MVVSYSAPPKPFTADPETSEPSPVASALSAGAAVDKPVEPTVAPAPKARVRSRGMGPFPPRLARGPRPKNGPHSHINLPPLEGQRQTQRANLIPPLGGSPVGEGVVRERAAREEEILTLEMRPARLHVSSLWHRLRFSGFSPMASQRRSTWKPGKPRRGRPEGTKGAGSRSL